MIRLDSPLGPFDEKPFDGMRCGPVPVASGGPHAQRTEA